MLTFHPLTPSLWADFERLFGPRGACAGCWCMYWKLRGKAFDENAGETARQMQKGFVDAGTVPGILAFADDEPVGWCAVEPRSAYVRLAYSRILKPVDEKEVWSITCFFVAKNRRRKGVAVELLKAAIEYVEDQGGAILEGYPVETKKDMPAPFIYTGTASAFEQSGFVEVARRSGTRPIFRYTVQV